MSNDETNKYSMFLKSSFAKTMDNWFAQRAKIKESRNNVASEESSNESINLLNLLEEILVDMDLNTMLINYLLMDILKMYQTSKDEQTIRMNHAVTAFLPRITKLKKTKLEAQQIKLGVLKDLRRNILTEYENEGENKKG